MSVASPVVLTWNGPERRIYLKQGITEFHWIDDIYKEYRNERKLNEDFRKYNAFMVASGNEAKGGGKATPRLLKLLEDVKVICWDENIEIYVGGEAITDNADIDPTLYDNSTRTQPLIINYQPPAAEVIVVDAIAESLDYGGAVYYDVNSGISGQVHPVGTSAAPVNNLNDLKVIAALYGCHDLFTLSDLTLTEELNYIDIKAVRPDLTLYPNGYKTTHCAIEGLKIDGDFNDSPINFYDCEVINALNISGKIKDSYLNGTILISADTDLTITDSESGIAGAGSSTIDMRVAADTTLSLRKFSGGITLINCDTPACVTTMSFPDGGTPHLEPSNTAGYISIRGTALLDDRSNGSVVDTSALADPTQVDELHKLQGLDLDSPMTVTPTQRSVASIDQTISGDGENVTVVTRN